MKLFGFTFKEELKFRFQFAFLFFIFLSNFSNSQIVFNGSTTQSGAGVGSLTYAKTIAAGNNRLIYVGVTTQNQNITSVTWNGLALTQFTIGTRNSMRVAMYYRAMGSSATATTANVVVTFAGGTDAFSGCGDYSGVLQSSPFINPAVRQAKSTVPSVTVSSFVGHLAVSLLGDIAASPTANGAGQTQYWTFTGSHSNRSTQKAGAATVVMSHTISANEDWVMIGGTMVDIGALPIELIAFDAQKKDKNVDLSWSTAAEINNDFFTVQRSLDAVNFEDIAQVDGAGNSNVQLNYFLTDEQPYQGVSYYRLKQTDFSGASKLSNIVAVNISSVQILNFYPNPTTDNSNVIINSPEDMQISFVITSSDGKIVSNRNEKLTKGVNTVNLNLASLATGNYIFSVNTSDKVLSKKEFIVK